MSGFMNRSARLLRTPPLYREKVTSKSKDYWINYMPSELMTEAGFSGFTFEGQVYLDEDLKGLNKRFTVQHELYHLRDKQHWLGYFGKELRANVICGLKDPLGISAALYGGFRKGYLKRYLLSLAGIGQD